MTISPLTTVAAVTVGKIVSQAAERLTEKFSFNSFLNPSAEIQSDLAIENNSSSLFNLPTDLLGDNSVRISRSQKALKNILEQFHQEIRSRLSAQGENSSISFKLQGDSLGGVKVYGDHPNKAEIEQLFKDDPELNNAFNYLSANYSLLRSMQQHQEFAQGYQQDPLQAGNIVPLLSPQNTTVFNLTINGDEVEVSFD